MNFRNSGSGQIYKTKKACVLKQNVLLFYLLEQGCRQDNLVYFFGFAAD